jgi:hypothetical protein
VTESIVVYPDPESLTVPAEQIARYAGGSRYKMDPEMKDRAVKILKYARSLIRPAFIYSVHDTARLEKDVQNALWVPGHGKQPIKITICICTLGHALENEVKNHSVSNDMLEAIFLDAAGVSFLESLAAVALRRIQNDAQKEGHHAGCRLGPGYADVPLDTQSFIFSLVDASVIDVSLNASFVMNPAKSLSFWVNWYIEPQLEANRYKCKSCRLKNCPYRIVP